ncbi:hypothetical protein EAO68_23800 [Streptomyces sp. wa22]|nr:hypothetical protein EAO68_23800 [Streptomyces sp. wa22]
MIRGNHINRSSPDRRRGTRTKFTRPGRRGKGTRRARSAAEYSGTSTRSCTRAAPTNHTRIKRVSPSSSRTPAYPARAKEETIRSRCSGPSPYQRRRTLIAALRTSDGSPIWCSSRRGRPAR